MPLRLITLTLDVLLASPSRVAAQGVGNESSSCFRVVRAGPGGALLECAKRSSAGIAVSTATICSTLNRFRLTASSFPIQGSSMPETLLQIGIKIGGPTIV
jgi:hypothetical protein